MKAAENAKDAKAAKPKEKGKGKATRASPRGKDVPQGGRNLRSSAKKN